ncbi:MAG: RNA polymerase sigma factor [Thermoguttaceae bacterium]
MEFGDYDAIVGNCLARARRWPTPRHWCRVDWLEEVRSAAWQAICEALQEYDPNKGVPIAAFLYGRALARVWSYWRREWEYARRCRYRFEPNATSPLPKECETVATFRHRGGDWQPLAPRQNRAIAVLDEIRGALKSLRAGPRRLLEQLYVEGRSEVDIAADLAISRQAVNKAKLAALRRLRQRLEPTHAKLRKSGC